MMKSNTHNNNEGNRNRAALVWMMIHVIVSSFVVFIIDWGETNKSPFFFSAIQHFFAFFSVFFYCRKSDLNCFQKRLGTILKQRFIGKSLVFYGFNKKRL